MGDYYLPLALFSMALLPFLGNFVQFLANPYSFIDSNLLFTPTMIYSILVVILIAWQYSNLKAVLLFCLFSLILELGFAKLAGAIIFEQSEVLHMSLRRTLLSLLIGYMVTKLVEAQRQQRHKLAIANEQLQQYNESLEELSISRERNRLARELHDTMAHHMSGMSLQLEGVRLLWERDQDKALELLEQSISTTREGIQETRRALKALRAQPLDDLGLLGAIREQAESMTQRQDITLEWKAPSSLLPLKAEVEQNIFRMFQEALRNVEQHAQAEHLFIRIEDNEHFLEVQLKDNGVGFVVEEKVGHSRFGLLGMQERAEKIGATLSFAATPTDGTEVHLFYPRREREETP